MNLYKAIIEFLADEFKYNPADLSPDLSLEQDFALDKQHIADLIQRLQDSLGVYISENESEQVKTIADLLRLFNQEDIA